MNEIYKKLLDTAYSAGMNILTDEYCCELLAMCYFVGQEQFVFDWKLSNDLAYAQRRLNLFGGETPNAELVPLLQKKIKELSKNNEIATRPVKLSEIKKYETSENAPEWLTHPECAELPEWAIELAKKINFKPWLKEQ